MVLLQHPERDAERILNDIWTKIAGFRLIPVDPIRIAAKLGIDVFEAELASSVAAAIVKKPNRDPVIMLNRADHPYRQRFSCAHEIGHFVLKSDAPQEYEYVDYRDESASTGSHDEEVYANQFAANLLMPKKEFRSAWHGSEIAMVARFEVSREAIAYRVKNLGLAVG